MASKHGKISLRYARALLRALVADGADKKRLFSVLESLSAVSLALSSNKEASIAIQNPMIDSAKKEQVIQKMLDAVSSDQLLSSFAKTVFGNGRFAAFSEIAESFRALVYQQTKMVSVRVTSARDMQEDERRFITDSLRSRLPGEPELLWQVDPKIIGGVIVEYEGHRIDASVRGALSGIERELLS